MFVGHSKRRWGVWAAALLALFLVVAWSLSAGSFSARRRWLVRAKLDTSDEANPKASSDWIYRLAFSPDLRYLAASSTVETVDVWRLADGTRVATFPVKYCYQLVLPNDGSVVAMDTGAIKVWELATQKLLRSYEPDFDDRSIRVKDHTGKVLETLPGGSMVLSPDGESFAVRDLDGPLEVRSIATSKLLNRFGEDDLGAEQMIWGLTFSPDGRRLVASRHNLFGGPDTTRLFFWDLDTGQEHVAQTRKRVLSDRFVFSADGSTLAVLELTREDSESSAPYLPVWDANERVEKSDVSIPAALYTSHGYDQRPYVVLSPEGCYLAVGNTYSDRRIHLFDCNSGETVCAFSEQYEARGPIEFSPDGRFLAAVVSEAEPSGFGHSSPSFVNVWELPSQRLRAWLYQEKSIQTLRFSPDGSLLATGGHGGEITIWEVPGAR